ncbi:hypothetical protein [Bowmanella yangjiangensis]|uniref:Uncharacterized protein n=1 Tax=Bowmanella yangjiangensis TaxID=2811230 RepID=A0ABS3CYR3_9ALTE|nr:hypothetical protein [Bowmanella yangjiangensis]MBN7822260.1 hypothetical protein [Bowmanella yangjiangensis]
MREHLQRIEKTTGHRPKELADQPECPAELSYLWEWFWQLPRSFNFTELFHWSQLTRRNLRAWEAEVLADLQRVWI